MDFLQSALVVDAAGAATDRHELILTRDFDELRAWTNQVYMPYTVTPGPCHHPDSALYAVTIGSMILSRFHYGIPVHLNEFSRGPGMGMALTTIRGKSRHWIDTRRCAEVDVGETFLVDTSRTEYWADFNPEHLQVNITFPHAFLADLYQRWFGQAADEGMWRCKFKFGGTGSAWLSLLDYACRAVAQTPEQVTDGPLGRHLAEMLGMHMVMEWVRQFERPAAPRPLPCVAPGYVRRAERYMAEHARSAPTLSEVALATGISVRALTSGFRQFRGTSPMAHLRELRLQGVRRDLLSAGHGATVASVAQQWGYANLGAFAASYRRRFGENPSVSLRRLRPS
ncbi:AraC family transcriptional regulator [Nitrogeniibacter mangrovi]|uniref:AraC family transcriptional regulator n=1 Tax=Nitrogeniibacter mangrovi TaxID=2016596 RepID=A0A6C1BAZ4_9RHOO|nr:AraC family transcriptional regulator [Nitrogeniibacter mangrovi]QID19444.1 AraC family transcriptional regulator [Nitrogeniibacter mangrovi]